MRAGEPCLEIREPHGRVRLSQLRRRQRQGAHLRCRHLSLPDDGPDRHRRRSQVRLRIADRGEPGDRVGFGAGLEPHVRTVPTDGRALLLTTDGIYGVPTSVLEWVVNGTDRLQLLAERLMIASEWNGGHDNATVVAVSFGNESGTQGSHGGVELWMPGQHLVVVPTSNKTTPAAKGALSTQEPPKSRPTKKRRTTKARRKRPVAYEGASTDQAERQLPIVTFDDDLKADDGLASGLQANPLVEEDREPGKPRTK